MHTPFCPVLCLQLYPLRYRWSIAIYAGVRVSKAEPVAMALRELPEDATTTMSAALSPQTRVSAKWHNEGRDRYDVYCWYRL